MQSLAPADTIRNPAQHDAAEVLAALRGRQGARRFSFRYELLSAANVKLADLSNVTQGSISQNWLADIKRTATFTFRDTGVINYLQDRIKPYIRLHLPPYGALDYVDWPQGVFLLTSPVRRSNDQSVVTRDVQGYDPLMVFAEEIFGSRFTVNAGVVYTTQVSTLLGSIPKTIQTSAAVLPGPKEWDPGTSKLKIINDLLADINYESLSFDEDGTAVVSAYRSPAVRAAEYDYADDADSLIMPAMEQELDLFGVHNQWIIGVSEPEQTPIVATYTNTDPSSPTSTVNRQRIITDYRTDVEAADQATLNAKVARLAFEASQVYEAITFTSAMMPIHSGNDVYTIRYEPMVINDKYAEHTWELALEAGARMTHRARRVVTV